MNMALSPSSFQKLDELTNISSTFVIVGWPDTPPAQKPASAVSEQ